MAWNGSGTFARTNGTYSGTTVWQQDAAALVDIEADRHDTHDQDLAAGINACLAKNGENAMTGDLDMGSNDITNAGAGAFTSLTVGGADVVVESASLTAGTGISVSGTFATSVTVGLSHLGFQSLTDPNADRIAFWDDSAGAFAWLAPDSSLSISSTTISVAAATDSAAGAVELATDAETLTGTATNRAITPANLAYRMNPAGVIYRNATQGPITTETKLQFNATDFDALLRGAFDTSSNYRYTATTGCRVLAIARVTITDLDSGEEALLTLKKSGTIIGRAQIRNDSGSNNLTRTLEITKLTNLTDGQYLEAYLTVDTDGASSAAGVDDCSLEILELS